MRNRVSSADGAATSREDKAAARVRLRAADEKDGFLKIARIISEGERRRVSDGEQERGIDGGGVGFKDRNEGFYGMKAEEQRHERASEEEGSEKCYAAGGCKMIYL